MHQGLRYIFLSLLAMFACNKETIDINLSTLDKQYLVVEGRLSDSLTRPVFTCTWTQQLGAQIPAMALGVNLTVETPDGIEAFSEIAPGTYRAENPFLAEYGKEYTIKFIQGGVSHDRKIKMPQPVNIVNSFFQHIDSSAAYTQPLLLNFNISSPLEQYLRYTVATANPPMPDEDTIWTTYNFPVYDVAKIPAGVANAVALNFESANYIEIYKDLIIRIELEIIAADVGLYLSNLKNYSTNATEEGKLLNPPYYYSNEAYGLGYGSIKYVIYHTY